jgi:hypothetical protein
MLCLSASSRRGPLSPFRDIGKEKTPVLIEDRGNRHSHVPRVTHVLENVEIRTPDKKRGELMLQKNESPGRERPPGASRFSTLFNVAAIGGKSPRTIDCPWTVSLSDGVSSRQGPCCHRPSDDPRPEGVTGRGTGAH